VLIIHFIQLNKVFDQQKVIFAKKILSRVYFIFIDKMIIAQLKLRIYSPYVILSY